MPNRNHHFIHDTLVNQIIFHALTNRKKHVLLSQKALRSLDLWLSNPQTLQQEREGVISQALNTSEGRVALAMAMVNPIRRDMEYQSMGRRLLTVDELPQCPQIIWGNVDFVGTVPVRQDITALPADPPRSIRSGWTYHEEDNGDVTLSRPSHPNRLQRQPRRNRR